MGVKGLIASLNEGKSFGCESEVTSRGEVGSTGDDVRSFEAESAEIWVRVGSCNEDAYDEKSDSCD